MNAPSHSKAPFSITFGPRALERPTLNHMQPPLILLTVAVSNVCCVKGLHQVKARNALKNSYKSPEDQAAGMP